MKQNVRSCVNLFLLIFFIALDEGDIELLKTYVSLFENIPLFLESCIILLVVHLNLNVLIHKIRQIISMSYMH